MSDQRRTARQSQYAGCLCAPAECRSCTVCSQEKCCASAHLDIVVDSAAARQQKQKQKHLLVQFFGHARAMFAAALGIEVLCLRSAELGQSAGMYMLGTSPAGLGAAMAAGYALAGVSTFLTILGRASGRDGDYRHSSCCSVLENGGRKGLAANLCETLRDFAGGARRLAHMRHERNLGSVLKSSLVILVTAESACILTAEATGMLLYQQSPLVSTPLSLLAGAFAVVAPQAWKKTRSRPPFD